MKKSFCFMQVSDRLINPMTENTLADQYYKEIWEHMEVEGYHKPEHFWEIPTWIAEISMCLDYQKHTSMLHHITRPQAEKLPPANLYLASVLDCNKDILRSVAESNPFKEFHFGGYIGLDEVRETFGHLHNVTWYPSVESFTMCNHLQYRQGTDYTLFAGMKCIPRLTMSNGCKHNCRFCSVSDRIIVSDPTVIEQQIRSMSCLDFELVYINDKTFGQASNWKHLKYIYNSIKKYNPKFRGFTVQTTCDQIRKMYLKGEDLSEYHVVNVELGVESYNNRILQKYNKPSSENLIDYAVDKVRGWGLEVIPNIIIGLPGESLISYGRTLLWLEHNWHRFLMLNVTNFVPYAGTGMDDMAKEPGDENQTTVNRSWHTAKESALTEEFSNLLYEIGLKIIRGKAIAKSL